MGVDGDAALKMVGIIKAFPGVLANNNIELEIKAGEVHGLLGEDGAGKTTLMNILYGLLQPDSGTIFIKGREVKITSPKVAVELGIGMVHQHFMLVENLTALENAVLGMPMEHPPILDLEPGRVRFREIAQSYQLEVDPSTQVWQLPVGNQQWLEILKQLFRNASILILDEPTSVLAPSQAGQLFETIRRLAGEGRAVIFITHKLEEIQAVTDRVTVLRDGHVVGTLPTQEATPAKLAQMMVGRPVSLDRRERPPCAYSRKVLQVENLVCNSDRGVVALNHLSLDVYAGEIVGIAGVDGNGQRELAEAIAGLRKPISGTIQTNGIPVTEVVRDTTLLGYIPEDRRKTGLVLDFSVAENLVIKSFAKRTYTQRGILRFRQMHKDAETLIQEFNIKTPGPAVLARHLSGGNQQRVVLARELSAGPAMILASQPTRGLDLGAVEAVHMTLLRERERGAAVLFISTELSEVMALSDRIVVLYRGRAMGVLEGDQADVRQVGELMLGHRREAVPAGGGANG